MRGKVEDTVPDGCTNGITPAHAGKRWVRRRLMARCWDHPRACGEKRPGHKDAAAALGSPPRMRGKGLVKFQRVNLSGITPAHAGKRYSGRSRRNYGRDHPRACGEKAFRRLTRGRERGSPPRMRGKAGSGSLRGRAAGITPAHAGKRRHGTNVSGSCWDHPRACGEKC